MMAGIEVSPEQAYDIPSDNINIQSVANDFEDIILGEEGSQKKSENWQEKEI